MFENSPDPLPPTGCRPAHDATMRLLDGVPDWDTDDARSHRESCARCKADLASARMIRPADFRLPATPTCDLTSRILTGVARDRSRRRTARWIGIASAGALAASLLVAFITGAFGPKPVGAFGESLEIASVPVQQTPSAFEDARSSIATLTRKIAEQTDPDVLSIPTPKIAPAKAGVEFDTLVEARQTAAKSFAPIASTARRAFSAFLRTAQPLNPTPVQ
jgi:hypothetical protein